MYKLEAEKVGGERQVSSSQSAKEPGGPFELQVIIMNRIYGCSKPGQQMKVIIFMELINGTKDAALK